VAFIPPATVGPARASRTTTQASTSKEAHALRLSTILAGLQTGEALDRRLWMVLRIPLGSSTYKLEGGWYWAMSRHGPGWIRVSCFDSNL
jgi:hypothetical protein